MRLVPLFLLLIGWATSCDANQKIDSSQIVQFQVTLNLLKEAKTEKDSVEIINFHYINSKNKDVSQFFKSKNITARSIYENIKAYPKFFEGLEGTRIDIDYLSDTLAHINASFLEYFVHFQKPNIYLVVGDLSVGGTIKGKNLFICLEMVSDNGIEDKSELPSYLEKITNKANLLTYICHETAHTLQRGFPLSDLWGMIQFNKNSLLNTCLVEGSADYIIYHLFGMNLNENLRLYVEENQFNLWERFRTDLEKEPFNYQDWVYHFRPRDQSPPDLGYFLGFQICESYVNNSKDKRKALLTLTKKGQYRKIYLESDYSPKD
ncbi:DUF2268 domain-containing putative Zn-dependent protease [Algoriphagus confluentis]|uniref:DUF2268 domain-containing protein n=1 Tax=Algoriphagus confluentis TaxID=1697556 RepID=A0ABQ6PTJ7_9BACT|nr:hypothetical protein Aconfl_36040 [Algoriphagus confluentis]